jgi:hypothetical protein
MSDIFIALICTGILALFVLVYAHVASYLTDDQNNDDGGNNG